LPRCGITDQIAGAQDTDNRAVFFILIRKMQPEKVLADLSRFRGRVLRTSLSPEQEERLQAALSGMGTSPAPGTTGDAPGAAQPAHT
jgi:uncharacterized membrane protein